MADDLLCGICGKPINLPGAHDGCGGPMFPFRSTAPTARGKQEGGDHYLGMKVQPWDVIDTWPLEQRIGFHRGNALKYIMRLGSKDDDAKEARKALHYLEKLVEVLKEKCYEGK